MLVLLIPAFKPNDVLERLVGEIQQNSDIRIVIVNDGSGVEFEPVFDRLNDTSSVSVVHHAVNLGKGAALKTGLNHILVQFPDVASVVTVDADGQHAVDDVLNVADASRRCKGSLVLGVRQFGEGTPFRSWFGNTVSKWLYRLLLGLKLSDTQTGLRGIPREFAERSLQIKSNRYEFETEQLALVSSSGLSVEEIPIRTIYEDHNASSHFNPFFDSIRIYFVVLRYALSSMATALVDFIAFVILFAMSGQVVTSNLGSRAVAMLVQYNLLQSFVFKSTAGIWRFVLFVAYVMLIGLVSSVLQIKLAEVVSATPIVAKIVVETLVFVFNFLFLRDILFTDKRTL